MPFYCAQYLLILKLLNVSQAGEGGLASVHTEPAGTLSFTPTLTEDLKSWDLDHEFLSVSY